MKRIRLKDGTVLTCTDDVDAARQDLTLVTNDRAESLVTGGQAEWVSDAPAQAAPDAHAKDIADLQATVASQGSQISALTAQLAAVVGLPARVTALEASATALKTAIEQPPQAQPQQQPGQAAPAHG